MEKTLTSQPSLWMLEEHTQKIMRVLNAQSGTPLALFVGGSVRNLVLNRTVEDIDIATKLLPNEVMKRLKENNIKVIPTGIDHGTVTGVIEGQHFEITTLRHDVDTDGRHAKISFTNSWLEDAKRRDFTMNTLLADIEGNIYDPLGCGIEDAKAGRVVFVGDPVARIAEDYLRILRLFRFHAYYGQDAIEQGALKACREAADKISTLSRERITSEFLKILSISDPTEILNMMFEHNVLNSLAGDNYQADIMKRLCVLQSKYNAMRVEARLFVLAGCQPKYFDDYLRLSHKQKNFTVKLLMTSCRDLFVDERAIKKAIYYHGNDLMTQGYLLNVAMGEVEEDENMIDFAKNWQAPKCPINGQSLMKEGYVTGPDLGQELKRREAEWLEKVLRF